MEPWQIILFLIAVIVILAYILKVLFTKYKALKHSKKSQSVKYGKMSENFMPFLESYPNWDSEKVKMIVSRDMPKLDEDDGW